MNNRRIFPLLWIAAALLAFCAYGCGTKTRISKKARPSTAQILTDNPIVPEFVGTGFVVREGLIAVDYRLVSNLQRLYTRLAGDDHVHSVESIAAIDDERNLAILRVSTHDAPALPLGEIGALQAGDPLYAAEIGEEGKIKVSKAEFSKTRTGPRGETMIEAPALPLDIVGAPVFNKQGEAVGIASQTFIDGKLKSYAVPSSALKPLIERAMGWGVRAEGQQPLDEKYDAVSQWNLPEGAAARFGKGNARHIAISPDGKTLASSGGAGVWLYDAETGKETALLRVDDHEMLSAAFSPDGSSIAAVCQKGWGSLIWIWDVRTGKKLLTLKDENIMHRYNDYRVIYSPDGSVIASAGYAPFQRYVRLWDARTGALINKLKSSEKRMSGKITSMTIAFSPDGTILASGMRNNGIELWDVQKAESLHTLRGHVDQVDSIEFSPDGRTLASVGDSKDKTVRIWDVDAKSFLFSIEEKGMRINDAAYSPNGQFIATGGGREIRIWDALTGSLLLKIEAGNNDVWNVAYFPDGNKLASLSIDGLIHIWDVWTGKKLRTIRGYSGFYSGVCAVAYSPDGRTIARAGGNGVTVWDARTGALLRKFFDASRVITWKVNTVAYSPDGQTLAGGAYNAQIWDMKTGALLHLLEGHGDRINIVAYSPDGQYLISGSYDKTARIWDARAGTHLHTLKGHAHIVSGAAFSPDGKSAATVSSDTLRIWDVHTGTVLKTVNPQQGSLRSVAYSPDQKKIAVGTLGQSAALLDASTGALLQTYQIEEERNSGDYGGFTSLAFSSDGQTLAASFNQTIWLWNIETGALQNAIKGHGDIVTGAAFSSDGQRLLSGSLDGSMLLWELNSVSSRP